MSRKQLQAQKASFRRKEEKLAAEIQKERNKRKSEAEREALSQQNTLNAGIKKASLLASSFGYSTLEKKGKIPTLGGTEAGVFVGAASFLGSLYLAHRINKKSEERRKKDPVLTNAFHVLDGVTDSMLSIAAYKSAQGSLKFAKVGEEIGALPSGSYVGGPYVGNILTDLEHSSSFIGANSGGEVGNEYVGDDDDDDESPFDKPDHERAPINY